MNRGRNLMRSMQRRKDKNKGEDDAEGRRTQNKNVNQTQFL